MDRFDLARWNAIRLILLGVLYILYKTHNLSSGGPDYRSAKNLMREIGNQVDLMDRLVPRGEDEDGETSPK